MKFSGLYVILLIIFIPHNNYTQENIKYVPNKSSIKSVAYELEPDSTYSIFIKLNRQGAKQIAQTTKRDVGKLLMKM